VMKRIHVNHIDKLTYAGGKFPLQLTALSCKRFLSR
jgi:hypothetical protein